MDCIAEVSYAHMPIPVHTNDPSLWINRPYSLTFRIGGIRIFRLSLRALWLDVPFTHLSPRLSEFRLPFDKLPAGLDALIVNGHPVAGGVPRVLRVHGMIRYVPHKYNRYYTEVTGTFEKYMGHFSAKRRHVLKHEVKKFARSSGGLCCREYKTPEEMQTFYHLARGISEHTWQEQLLDSGFPADRRFLDELLHLASLNNARGYVLFHTGEPAAYVFARAKYSILRVNYIGYNPRFRHLSPGTVLLYCALDRIFGERKFELVDFGAGEALYKRLFGTASTSCAQVCFLRPSVRNLLLAVFHAALMTTSSAARRVLDRVDLFSHGRNRRSMIRRACRSEGQSAGKH